MLGLAVGDALGMPTQELSRARAQELLGAGPGYLDGPPDNPISAGMPAGSVTDDTEQALLVAGLLVRGRGRIDPASLCQALLSWQDEMIARGSLDLLGPSTQAALSAVRAGADPATTGRSGTTNGAAMRVTPVGIACPATDLDALVGAVADAGRVTHDTPQARSGAAAVAAVVSAGVAGATFAQAAPLAVEAAARAGSAELARLVGDAVREFGSLDLGGREPRPGNASPAEDPSHAENLVLDRIVARFGTSLATVESVPAAFAVAALSPRDAWRAGWLGARLGGDADTIAAMAAAMVGACTGAKALPGNAIAGLRVDRAAVATVVHGLLELRNGRR